MATRSFPTTVTAMMAPFLIWAGHFGLVYAMNGIACERGLDGASLLGFPAVPVLVVVATVAALLVTGWILLRCVTGGGPADHVGSEDPREFARWFTGAGAASSLLAILWVGLPALLVPACG